MTTKQVELLNLGIAPIDEKATLIVESGLEWVKENTTLEFDINNDEDLKALPAMVRLFLTKFFDVNTMTAGVSSESINGLSQSFSTESKNNLIWQFAEELLGSYLKCQIGFIQAQRRWV